MSDKLTALSTVASLASGDLLYVVDVSDVTDDPAGSSRGITYGNFTATFVLDSDIGTTVQAWDSILDGTEESFLTAHKTKLDFIGVTQAVDLDTMESDIATNNAKVTNATHTGDVTGSTALTIANNAVSNAKAADMVQATIKGRPSGAGTGDPTDLTGAQVRTITSTETSTQLNTRDTNNRNRTNHTGTQLASTISDFSTAVAATAAVTANTAKVTNATHTGDVTGSTALTIANNAVTNAKAADMAQATIKGRESGAGTGDPTDLTPTQARTVMDVPSNSEAVLQGGSLTANLDAAGYEINDVGLLTPEQDATISTVTSTAWLNASDTVTYTYTGGVTLGAAGQPVVQWSGKYIFNDSSFYGAGQLFFCNGTISYDTNDSFAGGFYALAANPIYEADGATITVSGISDYFSNPTFNEVNSGALTISSHNAGRSSFNVNNTTTVTKRLAWQVNNATVGGSATLTGQAAFCAQALSSATNNTGVLLGTDTVPSGDYHIYATGDVETYLGGDLTINGDIVNVSNLPTSSAGLSSGDLWVDTGAGNVLKRV